MEFVNYHLIPEGSPSVNIHTLLFKEKILDSMTILNLIGYIEKIRGQRLKEEEVVMSNFESVEAMAKAFGHNE